MSRTVFLFDVDGVLVEPHGYRLSTKATIDFFAGRMGLSGMYPGEDTIALLESISMTSEWDMVPICLAAILDAIQAQAPDLFLPADLFAACDAIRACPALVRPPRVDYPRLVGILGPEYRPGMVYSGLALQLNRSAPAAGKQRPFPHLGDSPLLETLLADSRALETPTTRIFQHFSLGSQVFAQSYHLQPEFESISYLQTYDRPILNADLRDELLRRWKAGSLDLAIYTLRACRPRQGNGRIHLAYGQEAELVVESVGLAGLPLIGYGEVAAAADRLGVLPDSLCKPSPVHALGAILAALTRQEQASLLAAESLIRSGEAADFPVLPEELEIHVFEDSPGSVRSVCHAGELLARLGGRVRVHPWGIATNPAKVAALQDAGATIFPDVNQALQKALTS
jgi:hypothetical protein